MQILSDGTLGIAFARELSRDLKYSRSAQIIPSVKAKVKVFLQGPFAGPLMRDDLRSNGILTTSATTSPYQDQLPMADPATLLSDQGDDSIVDWVELLLRSTTAPNTSPIARRSVLVRRNGIVVDERGNEDIYFQNVEPGDYYLSVRHRNQLAVMTAEPVTLVE